MNGQPLPVFHGLPSGFVSKRSGFTMVKYIRAIEFVVDYNHCRAKAAGGRITSISVRKRGFDSRGLGSSPKERKQELIEARIGKRPIMNTAAALPGFICKLKDRKEVAEGTMAFRFEKPSGWTFEPGQYLDMTLLDPPETDSEGNVRSFSIASPHGSRPPCILIQVAALLNAFLIGAARKEMNMDKT
jgi:hypothetical protein